MKNCPLKIEGHHGAKAVFTGTAIMLTMVAARTSSAWQPPTRPLATSQIDAAVANHETPTDPTPAVARPLTDIQVASFKEVVPGQSRIDQVLDQLGAPATRETSDGLTSLVYKIAPFESVEIAIFDNIVESIVVYLATPGEIDQIATGLGLAGFVPAKITDVDGKLLGQAYPERGILLGFVPGDTGDGAAQVAQIAIEKIDPDSFLYRAKYNRGHHYLAAVQDLLSVQQLDPDNVESFALAAEILIRSGRYAEAARQVEQAIAGEGDTPRCRLLSAQVMVRQNKYAEAVAETKRVLQLPDISEMTRAEAHHHLGHLLGIAPVPNYKESLQHHADAIKTAKALGEDEDHEVRVLAKRLSFHAHLGIADNIARGPWKRHQEVSQRWVDRAAEIAKEMVKNEDADEVLLWTLQRKKLAVLAAAGSAADPAPLVDELIRISKKVVANYEDPWFRARVQLQTGQALVHAAQLQHWRREKKLAVEFATAGIKLMNQGVSQRDETPDHNYCVGRAYFLMGSVYAILSSDHRSAVAWFEKAESKLSQPLPEAYSFEKSLHGDRFISMGVSHWQTGKREKAAELTKTGIGILEDAVRSGMARPDALKIPYNNYGNMQKQLGNQDEARRYIEQSAKLESASGSRR